MVVAASVLKSGEDILTDSDRLTQNLRNALADKGISPQVISKWLHRQGDAHNLEYFLGHFLMRTPYDASSPILRQSLAASLLRDPVFTYTGTAEENEEVDESIAESDDRSGYRDRIGRGTARYFSLQGYRLPKFTSRLKRTPIVILGAGAASVLLARTLINAGYQQIQVLANQEVYGGLWTQKNVREGSKNNPFPFVYEQFHVAAAPGPGRHITRFLADLANPPRSYGLQPLPPIHKARVISITPGDLFHEVSYHDAAGEHTLQAPIVINCLGIGKPLPPSREGVMTTDVPDLAGIRWQNIITAEQAEKLKGKMLVFIGLGNSTAEMLVQVQRYQRAGLDIRYKVITHYPHDALNYPRYGSDNYNGKVYRLYRDILRPQLTKLAGDLEEIDLAFKQVRDSVANEKEELISQVTHWTVKPQGESSRKTMIVTNNDGNTQSFDFDQLYTLIGYGHSQDELEAMGMRVVDTYAGTIAADYDGEIQRVPGTHGRSRIYPGYFAFGSLLKSPQRPNAQVIPGILYGLPDVFTGITLRSAEYAWKGKGD